MVRVPPPQLSLSPTYLSTAHLHSCPAPSLPVCPHQVIQVQYKLSAPFPSFMPNGPTSSSHPSPLTPLFCLASRVPPSAGHGSVRLANRFLPLGDGSFSSLCLKRHCAGHTLHPSEVELIVPVSPPQPDSEIPRGRGRQGQRLHSLTSVPHATGLGTEWVSESRQMKGGTFLLLKRLLLLPTCGPLSRPVRLVTTHPSPASHLPGLHCLKRDVFVIPK